MDFVYVEDIARANILAMKSTVTDDVFNVASGDRDQPQRSGGGAARGAYRPARRSSAPGAQGQPGPAPAGRHDPGRGARLQGQGAAGRGPRRLVAWWWRPNPQEARARDRARATATGAHRPAGLGEAEAEAAAAADPVGLGHPGAGGGRLRERVRRLVGAPHACAVSELHHRAAPGPAAPWASGRATR